MEAALLAGDAVEAGDTQDSWALAGQAEAGSSSSSGCRGAGNRQGRALGGQKGQRLPWDHCTADGLADGGVSWPRRCGMGKGRLSRAQMPQLTMAHRIGGPSLPGPRVWAGGKLPGGSGDDRATEPLSKDGRASANFSLCSRNGQIECPRCSGRGPQLPSDQWRLEPDLRTPGSLLGAIHSTLIVRSGPCPPLGCLFSTS